MNAHKQNLQAYHKKTNVEFEFQMRAKSSFNIRWKNVYEASKRGSMKHSTHKTNPKNRYFHPWNQVVKYIVPLFSKEFLRKSEKILLFRQMKKSEC